MSFFDDDPFESIVREFFHSSPIKKRGEEFIKGESEDRIIDFVEDDKKVYLVFEIPGFNKEDITITIKGKDLDIYAKKKNDENIQKYLNQKLKGGIHIQKKIPKFVNAKKMSKHVNNGILEIIFDK